MALRSFWRIIFDVSKVAPEMGEPFTNCRLFIEMTLWDTSSATRFGRSITPIEHQVIGDVKFEAGVARFNGGYIKGGFNRAILEQELLDKIGEGLEAANEGLSAPFGDTNISIVAEVRLPVGAQEERPIFFMPQPSIDGFIREGSDPTDNVCLIETITNGGVRKVKWSISGDNHTPAVYFRIDDPPDTDPPRGFHRVRVHQDTGTRAFPYVYEILADVIPLGAPALANPSSHHFFAEEEQYFYIGGMPDPDGGGGMIGLHGEISFLDFDPNATCGNCHGANPG